MAQVGIVKEMTGVAQALGSDGLVRVLSIGDSVFEDEIINTVGIGSSVKLSFDSGKELVLNAEEQIFLDATIYANEGFENEDVQAAQQALLDTGVLPGEEPAAGAKGPATDGGFTPAYIADRSGALGDVSTYNLGTSPLVGSSVDVNEPVPVIEPVNETPSEVNDVVVSDHPTVTGSDTMTVDEDNNAVGNVLANDTDPDAPLAVSTFTVAGDTYTAGQVATINGVGTMTVGADGSYIFTPISNWSGAVPQVTYTTDTGSYDTLDINVAPVADAPDLDISISAPSVNYDLYTYQGDSYFVKNGKGELLPSTGNTELKFVSGRGYGIEGSGNADDDSVDKNETLLFDLKEDTSSMIFGLHIVNPELNGKWTAYSSSGKVVDWGAITDQTTQIVISGNGDFRYVAFDPHTGGGGVPFGGFYVIPSDGNLSYEYTIDINAGLVDIDGSESLSSITLSNLPADVTLYADNVPVTSTDSNYTVDAGSVITLQSAFPIDADSVDDIIASVTSTEQYNLDGPNDTSDDNAITTVTNGDIADDTSIVMGYGNDILNVEDDIQGDAHINMGDGNDTLNVGGNITSDFDGIHSVSIDMGNGDDTLTLGGVITSGTDDSVSIDFGEGNDTLIYNGTATSLNLQNVQNIETIHLENTDITQSITAEDVFNATDINNSLSITGINTGGISLSNTEWTLTSDAGDMNVFGAVYDDAGTQYTISLQLDDGLAYILA